MASDPVTQSLLSRSAAPESERRQITPGVLLLILLLGYFLFRIRLVVELTVLAVLYGTAIERPVRALERRLSRRAAIMVVDGLIIAALVVPALAFAPSASHEVNNLRTNEPAQLRKLEANWRTSSNTLLRGPGTKLIDRAITTLEAPPKAPSKTAVTIALRAFKVLIAILACITMAFSYLMEKDRLRGRLLEQIGPESRVRATRLWDACEGAVGGWLRSRIILGIVVGIVTTIVFGALRIPYWPLLGILAGLTEPVPIIGPWAGGIPAALLALTRSPLLGVTVVLIILGRQLLVDTVLVPRITKDAVGLSPLTVFVAVLAGTELLGAPGALLAIPVAAVVQIAIVDYLTARRGVGVPPDYGWRWLLARRSGQPG